MDFISLGRVSFDEARRKQEEAVEKIAFEGAPERVYLLEHPHVFTLGRGGEASNLLARQDWADHPIQLVRINRGGDITYHGPGQLVGYPHLDLRSRGRDVHRYLRGLEEVLIRTAARWGVHAFRRAGLTGVWTDRGKLASIGVGVRHWVTLHGFALNACTDLRYFQLINPCGMEGCRVTSFSHLLERHVTAPELIPALTLAFREVFLSSTKNKGSVGSRQ
ncbi:MAG: lipoyl(octanoyl) transferase LipB [Acidobacteriota bacterium]